MAYSSLTVHLLISAPGDVPAEDHQTVRDAIDAWNFIFGRRVVPTPVTVLPVNWRLHSYSQMGIRPQAALNEQFVEEADFALVMFANRLGLPTGEAESGTVEEFEVMREAGKHVSMVHNRTVPVPPDLAATEERVRLLAYLKKVMADPQGGLVYQYDSQVALAQQINLMLSAQAQAFSQAASKARRTISLGDILLGSKALDVSDAEPDPNVGVWPSAEFVERAGVDNRGRPKVTRKWYLVLTNRTGKPVKNVDYRYEPESFSWRPDDGNVDLLPPDGTIRFSIEQSLGSAGQANCIVTWQYASGADQEEHETTATVRT